MGRQAFVSSLERRSPGVAVLDASSTTVLGNLADGAEVEILGWVPKGLATRYHVRSVADGIDGWIGVSNLRATRKKPVPGAAATKVSPPVSIPPRMPHFDVPEPEAASPAPEPKTRAKGRTRPIAKKK